MYQNFLLGYKLVINRQATYPTKDLKLALMGYLPKLTIESDPSAGDVVFRTNQQPNEQFIQALRKLEMMKNENEIRNYGVQNSTMDDVFLRITGKESQSTSKNTSTVLEEQCRRVFGNREFYTGIRYYLSQYHGLMIKTLRVHYRRWVLTLIILFIPIVHRLVSNLTSRSGDENGTYKMEISALNPQTILYNTDPIMERYFQASINHPMMNQVSGNISEINQQIYGEICLPCSKRTQLFLIF